jgi:DNA topoisomerase IA
MDITNTMCRLSDLTQDQINSLVKTMTKSGLCDFSTGAPLIRVTKEGTWVGYDGPTIVTYTEMMQLLGKAVEERTKQTPAKKEMEELLLNIEKGEKAMSVMKEQAKVLQSKL